MKGKYQSSWQDEDAEEALYRKTQLEMEGHCLKGLESLEGEREIGHNEGNIQRYLQDPIHNTERRWLKVRRMTCLDRLSSWSHCIIGANVLSDHIKWQSFGTY